jgi:hypothetical protein
MIKYIYEIVAVETVEEDGKKSLAPIGDALYSDDKLIAQCLAEQMAQVYKRAEKVLVYENLLQ